MTKFQEAQLCLDELREHDRRGDKLWARMKKLISGAAVEYSGLKPDQVVEVSRNGFTCFLDGERTALSKGSRYTVAAIEFRPLTELRSKTPRLHLTLRISNTISNYVVVLCTAKQIQRYFKVVKPEVTP